MSIWNLFQSRVSKKRNFVIVGASVIIYIALIFSLRAISEIAETGGEFNFILDAYATRGVLTQLQLLLTIYIALALYRIGYITAIVLNMFSIMGVLFEMQHSGNADSMPGLISSIAAIIIATLIMKYKREAIAHVDHIEEQRRKLERSEKKLYDQAYTDVLTGKPNRFFAIEKLNHNIELAKENHTKVGVIFMDLDSFKIINDTLGHSAGDEVLLKIANRLDSLLHKQHTVSRFGGDEFIIVCSDIHEISEIEGIAKAILKELTEPIYVHDEKFNLTGSVGISLYPGGGADSEELIANADIAMYEAKKQGKNRYMFFDNEMRTVINRRNGLINHLHHAIEKDELYLDYQPQINTITQEINGLEVLLRWNNAEYGRVSPGEFIPLAERTGLIKKIGLWVFETACMEYQQHSKVYKSDLKLALNFSIIQIIDKHTIDELVESLQRTGMKPQNIEIEITESVDLTHESIVVENLNKLRKIGFTIAIDDFGKEYSSFMRIRHLPLDLIKIDMEFIQGIGRNSRDKEIVKGIILLANSLGVEVLAEGVEEEEQYRFLKQEKCHSIQGYYFYKPMALQDVLPFITTPKETSTSIV